ncbi:Uncharacterised protein [Legionella steigerwaltii]|uniref:Uncharacterized protein n=1 Tax=Legionella steigerwaltii TaxID=460 RepID=A0A378L9V3_9GAMM|nr:hypothetical protein [Legionella steigerwaltii]KTD80088.1 hypothetical protein Lstg_0622 [Legionella steigerwaltii]STY23110.1 Uncharacterised protein [Legionella steigerwaltii]
MRLLSIPYILFGFAFSSLAIAKHTHHSDAVGLDHNFSKQELSIYIDQSKIFKNIPNLQKAGLVDANLSNTEAGFYKTELAALVSIPYVMKIIHNLYSSNRKTDQIYIKSYLLATDLYGNNTPFFCYSFTFNRQLYQKINWKTFQTNDIVKIAPNFKTSDTCKILDETSPLSI